MYEGAVIIEVTLWRGSEVEIINGEWRVGFKQRSMHE